MFLVIFPVVFRLCSRLYFRLCSRQLLQQLNLCHDEQGHLPQIRQVNLYQVLINHILMGQLRTDPEWVHQRLMSLVDWLDQQPDSPLRQWWQQQLSQRLGHNQPSLAQYITAWNLHFSNPLGLAAGFDKNGFGTRVWPSLGFGFAEIGTVTLHAQPGNPRPRLFRLFAEGASLNRMGFNNEGAERVADRLQQRSLLGRSTAPVGINLGKTKITPLAEATQDYLESFRRLRPWGDYFVVNVSSPNTPGLRSLQSREQLEPILAALQTENLTPTTPPNLPQRPLLVKIAPDLTWEDISDVLDLARQYQLAGIIATNTTIRRDNLKTQILPQTGKPLSEEAGGIGGAPLRQRSTEVIRFIYQQTGGKMPIVGVGGIFTAEDAWEKITAGASLLQVYTGWIYEGPWMVKTVLSGLAQRLEQGGFANLQAAVGSQAG